VQKEPYWNDLESYARMSVSKLRGPIEISVRPHASGGGPCGAQGWVLEHWITRCAILGRFTDGHSGAVAPVGDEFGNSPRGCPSGGCRHRFGDDPPAKASSQREPADHVGRGVTGIATDVNQAVPVKCFSMPRSRARVMVLSAVLAAPASRKCSAESGR